VIERAFTCPECGGTRLNEGARSSRIRDINIADACSMQISDLSEWVRGLDKPSVAPLLAALLQTLDSFMEIGLGYLSLDRPSGTLSGGEAQRVKMIRHLGSSLTDVAYVFDEPTTGLHLADVEQLLGLLDRLVDSGKSVIVIEHHQAAMAHADWIIDLGPGAGHDGADRLRGHTRRPRRHPLHPHRRAPRGLLRHLTEALADTVRRVLSSVSTRPTRPGGGTGDEDAPRPN
jgi:excinuclease UvrABC ATPase subunit